MKYLLPLVWTLLPVACAAALDDDEPPFADRVDAAPSEPATTRADRDAASLEGTEAGPDDSRASFAAPPDVAAGADRALSADTAPGAESPLFMVKRGNLILEDDFSGTSFTRYWKVYMGQWRVADGALEGQSPIGSAEAGTLGRVMPADRLIVQFSFKFAGAKSMAFFFNHETGYREHLGGVHFTLNDVQLTKASGFGSTTQNVTLDSKPLHLEAGRWYTATLEVYDQEMLFSLDGKYLVYGVGVDPAQHTKDGPKFLVKDPRGSFDDVRIWEALPDPSWAARRASLTGRP